MTRSILYFHHSIGNGGAPRSLAFLIAGLDRAEFSPIVAMPARTGNDVIKALFEGAGAKVIEARDIRPFHGSTVAPCVGLKNKAYAVLSYNKTVQCGRDIVESVRPDLVHLNSTCLVGIGKGAHSVSPKIPVLAHVREPLLQNRWGRMLARMNRKHVNWFIGIDRFGLDSIGLDQSRGTVIYNFVDRKQLRPDGVTAAAKRSDLGWRDKVVFLSMSRVAKSNGALELANLVSEVDSQLPSSALFVVAGFDDHPVGYAADAERKLGSIGRCRTLKFQTDVGPLINAADVIIAPFITPHSARSVFEGAAIGKPSIVSNHPNLRELIDERETGFIFDWDERNSFVEAINRLCESQCRQSMGQAAFKLAEIRFDSQNNVEQTMQVYREMLANRQSTLTP